MQPNSSQANMPQPKRAVRILFALTLSSACAIDAYGWSSASLLHLSTRQEEKTMTFVGWIALGLAAGLIRSGLVERRGEGSLPDFLIGVVGAMVGGWLWYTFGAAGVNGLNLVRSEEHTSELQSLRHL